MSPEVPTGWTEVPHLLEGQRAARLLRKGTEVHFEIDPAFRHRVIRKQVTRDFLRPVLDEEGFLTTKMFAGDKVNRKFVERIGFRHTWTDGTFDYFMLTALPFETKKGN